MKRNKRIDPQAANEEKYVYQRMCKKNNNTNKNEDVKKIWRTKIKRTKNHKNKKGGKLKKKEEQQAVLNTARKEQEE